MSTAKITRNYIDSINDAQLFTYEDIPCDKKSSVAIELSRLYKKGIIKKVSKGKFYKPKKRVFGEVEPSSNEKILSYLNNSSIDYETGLNGARKLGLTTQVSKIITIATDQPSRMIELDNIKLRLVEKRVNVPKSDIFLVQILDAIKDIKKIPATTPEKTFIYLKKIIEKEDRSKQKKLAEYALKYNPRTRALVGAILRELGLWELSYLLKETLNPLTKYKVGISNDILPSKSYWNIV